MNNIMLDLETMGNSTNSAIVSIGAVKFDCNDGIGDKFHVKVKLDSCLKHGLTVSGSTIEWWMKQSEEARQKLYEGYFTDLPEALTMLSRWLDTGIDYKVWGNGADFDNAILANAYSKLGLQLPWKFYNSRCYRTVKNIYNDVPFIAVGTKHDALSDAISQAEHLITICNKHNLHI